MARSKMLSCPLDNYNGFTKRFVTQEELELFFKKEGISLAELIRSMPKNVDDEDDPLPCFDSGIPSDDCSRCPLLIEFCHSDSFFRNNIAIPPGQLQLIQL